MYIAEIIEDVDNALDIPKEEVHPEFLGKSIIRNSWNSWFSHIGDLPWGGSDLRGGSNLWVSLVEFLENSKFLEFLEFPQNIKH